MSFIVRATSVISRQIAKQVSESRGRNVAEVNDHLVGFSISNSAKYIHFKHPYSLVEKFTTGPCGAIVVISCYAYMLTNRVF